MASTAPITLRYSPSAISSKGFRQSRSGFGLRSHSRAGSSRSTDRSWSTTALSSKSRSSASRRGIALAAVQRLTLREVAPVI